MKRVSAKHSAWFVVAFAAIVSFTLCRQTAFATIDPATETRAADELSASARQAFARGDFQDAAAGWARAAQAYRQTGDTRGRIDALINLASAYEALGQINQAIKALDDRELSPAAPGAPTTAPATAPCNCGRGAITGALPLAEEIRDKQRILAAKAALGRVCTFSDQASLAEGYLTESLKLSRQLHDTAAEASVQNSLGILYGARRARVIRGRRNLANYDRAVAACNAAIDLATRDGNPLLAARAAVNKALAAAHHEQYADTIAMDLLAAAAVQKLPDSHDKAQLLLTIGRNDETALQAAQSPRDVLRHAYDAYQLASRIAESLHDRPTMSYALGYMAHLYESQRQFDDALVLTRQALFVAQELGAADAVYRWEWQTGRILKAQGRVDDAIKAYTRALESLHDIRNDIALSYGNSNMRSSFREVAGQAYSELADLLLQRADREQGTPQERQDMVQARNAIELLKVAEIDDYLQDRCVDLYKRSQQDVDSIAAKQQAAIVYMIPLEDRTELLVTFPQGLARFKAAVGAQQLSQTVHQFRQYLEDRTSLQYVIPARELYKWLIAPLESELSRQRVQTIVFVPDGALRTIPMAALIDPQDNKFLIEKYAVAVSPGLNLMEPRRIARDDIAVIENGLSVARRNFPELKHVPDELKSIHAIYGGLELLNETFTVDNLRRRLRETDFSIVHIASHGECDEDARRTFLLTYEGDLDLNRLELLLKPNQFKLKPVELLTLSACQTASGDDRAALGLAGIAIKAGARSAVATLWSVNDQAAAVLVGEFYAQLRQHPDISKAEALRRAQVKLISDKRYKDPCFWSPFLLIGNWL